MAISYKYSINHNFFSPEQKSPTQFYWAGFLASTANIVRNSSGERAYRIEFNTSIEDTNHLEKMVSDFESDIPIREFFVNIGGKLYARTKLVINSKVMVIDLSRFGLGVKKKSDYVMPNWLMQHQLVRDFIRGWVDGRGNFYFNSQNKDSSKIRREFRTNGPVKFLEQICTVFASNLILTNNKFPITINKSGFGTVRYSCQADIEAIANFLYQDAIVAIERKKDSALDMSNLIIGERR